MSMPKRALVAAAAAGALVAIGCGGAAGDLIALEVSGGFQREAVRITVTGDGRGRCGSGELLPLDSDRLIEAREVERELAGLAEEGASFGAADPDRREFVARTRAGTVRWPEGAPGLPTALPRAAVLARALERELCGP